MNTTRAQKEAVERERKRRWRANNPEKTREADRRRRANNPEKNRKAVRRYRANNPEKVRLMYHKAVRRWRANNTAAVNYFNATRRALQRNASMGCQQQVRQIYKRCRELRRHGLNVVVDHVIPLAKGGSHSSDNLQIICAFDNSRKGASTEHSPFMVF